MEFSIDQRNIIDAKVNNILVSAAAGSGKTTVLVERIITKILDGEYNIDELLVVTFTNEAADNMRKKISDSLNGKLKELKLNKASNADQIKRLSSQIDRLPNSYIQTINSFCARVIKEKGYSYTDPYTGKLMEPGIPILDDNTRSMILKDSITEAVMCAYSSYANGEMPDELKECFDILTESNGDGRNDSVLMESLEDSFGKLRSIPDYLNNLDEMYLNRIEDDKKGIIVGLDYILDNFYTCAYKAYSNIDKASFASEDIKFISKPSDDEARRDDFKAFLNSYKPFIKDVVDVLGSKTSSYEEKFSVLNKKIDGDDLDIPKLPNSNSSNDRKIYTSFLNLLAPIWEFIDTHRQHVCGKTKTLPLYTSIVTTATIKGSYYNVINKGVKWLYNQQLQRNKMLCAYIYLLKEVDLVFREQKQMIHGMDFSDQEHIAYEILSNSDNSDARDYYKEKFKEIYIDEYQDNSKLQDAIIELFSRKCDGSNTDIYGNVFRVGDIKQSIYKFRYASPDLFNNRMKAYENKNGGVLYLLNNNYRSDETVIDFVNMVFRQLLSEEEGMEITYDSTQELVCGQKPKEDGKSSSGFSLCKPNVVLCSTSSFKDHERMDNDDVSKKKYLYRQAVLNEVIKYTKEGFKLEDICVLTRSNKTALVISQYLNEAGFPSKVAEKRELFDDNDIKGLTNLIIAISNQYRDEYLLGVLLSDYRFSNFTLDEVAGIIAYCHSQGLDKDVYLIDKIKMYSSDEDLKDSELGRRINKFLDVFNNFRYQNIMTDIGILIENIYIETGIRATLNKKGKAELDKLTIFKDFLCTNFIARGSDIAGIASDLENMQLKLSSEVSVRVDDNSDKKIRCMTCHSSKGLEFGCVILAEMVTEGNKSNNRSNISFDGENGFVVKDYVYDEFLTYDSLECIVTDDKQKLSSIAEELRLLYVALTRAKNRLSVVVDLSSSMKSFLSSLAPVEGPSIPRSSYLGPVKNMRYAMTSAISRTEAFNEHIDEKEALDLDILKYCALWDSDAFTCEYYMPDNVYREETGISACYPTKEESVNDKNKTIIDVSSDSSDDGDDNSASSNSDSAYFEEDLKTSDKKVTLHAKSFDEDGKPVFETYSYETSTTIPFKVSVSQLKNEFEVKENVSMNLELPDLEDYIETKREASSASEIGTFVHSIMRYIDFGSLRINEDNYDIEIDRLVNKGLITQSQLSLTSEFKSSIISFANTDICKGMLDAMENNKLYKEKPIVFSVDMGNNDYALVQGVIDMFYIDIDGKAILVDYKTDNLRRFGDDSKIREEAIRRHKVQIDYYCAALTSSGIEVKKRYLCLLRHNMMVEL